MANWQYYHYTNAAGAEGIINERLLRSLNGVMLSTLKPEDHSRDDILHSIHGSTIPTQFKDRADKIVYVNATKLDSSKLNQIQPNLFKYSGDIRVSRVDVKDTPHCVNRQSSSSSTNNNTTGSSRSSARENQFYYYTNQRTAARIRTSGQSAPNCIVLLTTMEPENHFRDQILETLYGEYYDRNLYASCADWCIKMDSSKLDTSKLVKISDEVYEYSGVLEVSEEDVMDKPKCNKGGPSNGQNEYFYHYTDSKGAHAIKQTGYIKISRSSGSFGPGVYFTDMEPTVFFRDDILQNNYGAMNYRFVNRADFVVRVKKSDLVHGTIRKVSDNITNDCTRTIFVYDREVRISPSDVYLKPKCYRAE
ncbi:hypothetical protein Bhyg_04727 [Pseudolycoriella hygida]|uniref:Tox-ART-HYD1 domain-containing protein n=1 Tax=Pseudolycoriella hygida TaxID=35572 RepID=A0A9Q0NH52_9DIPT|nr:hypothetical protein Bhyg_04727 [Pseudolycoriella hygida]